MGQQCERITELVRELRKNFKELLETKPKYFAGSGISFGMIEEVVEELGWTIDWNAFNCYTDSWDLAYETLILVPNELFIYAVKGCMYTNTIIIDKQYVK